MLFVLMCEYENINMIATCINFYIRISRVLDQRINTMPVAARRSAVQRRQAATVGLVYVCERGQASYYSKITKKKKKSVCV